MPAIYTKHPIRPTIIGQKVFRARLSLGETQPLFAKRFMVSHITVHKWETGKVLRLSHIYQRILDSIVDKLKTDGRWMSDETFKVFYQRNIDSRGNIYQ